MQRTQSGGFMQVVAKVTSSGMEIVYDAGAFAVNGERITVQQVMEYDSLGALTWVSDETREWAQDLANPGIRRVVAAPSETSQPRRAGWLRKTFNSPVKIAAVAVGLVIVVGLVLSGLSSLSRDAAESAQKEQALAAQREQELDFYATAARTANGNLFFQTTAGNVVKAKVFGQPYASVYESAQYRGQVIITVVFPSGDAGYQYLFDPTAPTKSLGARKIAPGQVDASLTDWNAEIDDQGRLLVIGREEESLPQ